MNRLKKALIVSVSMACMFLLCTAARADSLTLTLAAPDQTGGGGQTLTFYATVTNNSGATVYLNGDGIYVDSPLTLDDTDYYNNFPASLAPAGTYSGDLFTVTIPDGTPLGLYTGYFNIVGGADGNAQDVIASASFDITVTPEPAPIVLLLTGMAMLAFLTYRKSSLSQIA